MFVIATLQPLIKTFVFVAHIDGMVEAVTAFDAPRCAQWHRL
jgi:hypothetical protein